MFPTKLFGDTIPRDILVVHTSKLIRKTDGVSVHPVPFRLFLSFSSFLPFLLFFSFSFFYFFFSSSSILQSLLNPLPSPPKNYKKSHLYLTYIALHEPEVLVSRRTLALLPRDLRHPIGKEAKVRQAKAGQVNARQVKASQGR